jgi:hypothetical protein
VWRKFFSERTKTLWERFPGYYRALVVETNDPLNMMRIRFKCPDMHDFSLTPDNCPWAVPAHDLGGPRAGRFSHPCIGDWVWITFEKQHPYGPIWTGFAQPMRRKFYTYPQVFQITPLPVNEEGKPTVHPQDYDKDYLSKDGRPMAHGWVDRYGNIDIHSSIGYFPVEHKNPPPPPDHDALSSSQFKQQQRAPEVNSPDKKYMARVTKYGCMIILSDQGYHWHKESDTELGEFEGDTKKDEQYEIKRWEQLQKTLNENSPTGDHRRAMMMTRYGSRFEIRDTGWAQLGPRQSHSRDDEFGPKRILSKEEKLDLRWIKIRTKGGMLWQAYDKGFDPDGDKFIQRKLSEEQGTASEKEDEYWKNKDARWIRTVTRYGLKIVLDDRGSDDKNADKVENPRGNGILIKGRRSPGTKNKPSSGTERGFFWEFNENDAANHTTWGTPLGLAMEMNDRYQYMMLTASMGREWTAEWQGIKENEFIRKPTVKDDPEQNSYHLKLDHDNEYLRLKTRGGRGNHPLQPANGSAVSAEAGEIHQGIEAHDGREGQGPWVEMVDCQHRGFWLSKHQHLGVWRAKQDVKMFQWIDDQQKKIVIYNDEKNGRIEIYTAGRINLVGDGGITFNTKGSIDFKADRAIRFQAADTRFTIAKAAIQTNKNINAKRVHAFFPGVRAGSGAGKENPAGAQARTIQKPELPNILEPDDRGKTYNGPFEECPKEEVEHPDPPPI